MFLLNRIVLVILYLSLYTQVDETVSLSFALRDYLYIQLENKQHSLLGIEPLLRSFLKQLYCVLFYPLAFCRFEMEKKGDKTRPLNYLKCHCLISVSSCYYYSNFFLRLRIMSSVMRSRSYCGFQPHSLRAQLSSMLSGQLSAMACLMGSGS